MVAVANMQREESDDRLAERKAEIAELHTVSLGLRGLLGCAF